jgi:hypothetical protein
MGQGCTADAPVHAIEIHHELFLYYIRRVVKRPCHKGVQLTRAPGRCAWGFSFVLFLSTVPPRAVSGTSQILGEDTTMTVRELRAALATMEATSNIQVVLFKNDGTSEVFELEEVLSNEGHAQLEIYEPEDQA